MTPQRFSYGTLGSNNMIYIPPYGLSKVIDYMLKLNPITYEITRIPLTVDSSYEKYTTGVEHNNKLYFLPYNESNILIVDLLDDSVSYVNIEFEGKAKYNMGHLYNDTIVGLPYGIDSEYNYLVSLDTVTNVAVFKYIDTGVLNDTKKWHTSVVLDNMLIAMPRGERTTKPYFPYRVEINLDTLDYVLTDLSSVWEDIDNQPYVSNKKYTTLAKCNGKLFAPPYSENDNFDVLAIYNGNWRYIRTQLTQTSRKYYTHTVASNGKIYFPPAGHAEEWSQMLVIDSVTETYKTIDLGIGKESKKYFAGVEANNKLYYIPRGGCVCEPENTWKSAGDLLEVLVINLADDSFYTIDITEYFKDNTTIEKYNQCVLADNKIFAFPYGESNSFQTLLVFDTVTEQVIHTIDLNVY